MLSVAANRLGVDVHIYRSAESDDRCSADQLTTAAFDDTEALSRFVSTVDAVTVESEDIPADTLRFLEPHVAVHPSSSIIEICQDRLVEKQFLRQNGVQTAPFGAVDSASDLATQLQLCGPHAILKTRRFGYDGKGQTRVEANDDLTSAWQDHGAAPSILEAVVDFDFEISVIAARSRSGEIAMYEPGRNEHRGGILRTATVPAQLDPDIRSEALRVAETILESLNYVGVMGIEFFVVGREILVNELAPRVHNSGHWTQDGCAIDQFEQHVRAVMGYSLGSPERHSDVVMTNLIGDEVDTTPLLSAGASRRVHLYGKREVRPGRKMGHTNAISPKG